MEKIDVEKSVVRKFNSRYDLSNGVLDLGQQGYFSDYEDFKQYAVGTLYEVKCREGEYIYPFTRKCKEDGGEFEIVCYKYFIPANLVVFKEEPKKEKYKPIYKESDLPFKLGDTVAIRIKDSEVIVHAVVNSFVCNDESIVISLTLGSIVSPPDYFFEHYEILVNGIWKPLGVEEDEKD